MSPKCLAIWTWRCLHCCACYELYTPLKVHSTNFFGPAAPPTTRNHCLRLSTFCKNEAFLEKNDPSFEASADLRSRRGEPLFWSLFRRSSGTVTFLSLLSRLSNVHSLELFTACCLLSNCFLSIMPN